MHPLVNKGAKNDMKVSAENALKGMVSVPKKDEQEMIGHYIFPTSTTSSLFTSARQIFIKKSVSTISHRKPIKNYKC